MHSSNLHIDDICPVKIINRYTRKLSTWMHISVFCNNSPSWKTAYLIFRKLTKNETGKYFITVESSIVSANLFRRHAVGAKTLGLTWHVLRSCTSVVYRVKNINIYFWKRNKRCAFTEIYYSLKSSPDPHEPDTHAWQDVWKSQWAKWMLWAGLGYCRRGRSCGPGQRGCVQTSLVGGPARPTATHLTTTLTNTTLIKANY